MATQSTDYDFSKIESYWQTFWVKNKTFEAKDFDKRPKYYSLVMLPYPSGDGLHIGHPESYTASDILSRYRQAKGFNVLQPMGWDAFGLPAEQHAINTGTHPRDKTQENIANFRRQLKSLGFAFNWDREIDSTDPNYYKWTQWIFLQLFKKGLAYVDERPVWWCPALGTALANEEVIEGRSERGNHPVERRNLRQWVLRITAYADKLLKGLDDLDWPESTKSMQRSWIGRSEGANVNYDIENIKDERLTTYTTRIDTLFGVTFLVISPEHPLVDKLTTEENQPEMKKYVQAAAKKSELARAELSKHKTGVFTGSYAIHPLSKEKLPIWVADYVLMSYGTGVVQGVPSNDERDYEFAKKFDLPINAVISKDPHDLEPPVPYFEKGYLVNSGKFDGLHSDDAIKQITEELSKDGHAEFAVNYKLRDWLFSRQRYWGEPFPILWVDESSYKTIQNNNNSELHEFLPENPVTYNKGGKVLYAVPLPTSELPLELPEVESYQPTGGMESPLAGVSDWVNLYLNINTGETVPASQKPEGSEWVAATREFNTMPQWAGSCWYYLRYIDPHNDNCVIDPELEKYWGVPDIYIGGAEHAVLHLLYARFWHQVLHDIGVVSHPEPFPKVVHQGLILGEPEYHTFKDADGDNISAEFVGRDNADMRSGEVLNPMKLSDEEVTKSGDNYFLKSDPKIRVLVRTHKMSKSRGNVVNPDVVIEEYGADALRLYEMFLGPLEANKPWSSRGIEGIVRFLRKVWREYIDEEGKVSPKIIQRNEEDAQTERILHETIKKVSEDIEALSFNTAISQMMIFINHIQKAKSFTEDTAKAFLKLLAPFAPHLCEELWERLGEAPSVTKAEWPVFDPAKLVLNEVNVMIQVNGKLRGQLRIDKNTPEDEVLSLAKANSNAAAFLEGKNIIKEIYVPGKIVNFVVK